MVWVAGRPRRRYEGRVHTSRQRPARVILWSVLVWVGVVGLTTVPAAALTTACVGDCNVDGVVTVDELVLGSRIGLGQTTIDACRALDVHGHGTVSIDELLAAVRYALSSCPTPVASLTPSASPSPTSTATATITLTPTRTATPSTTPSPTVTPTPTSFGPQITFFGVASAQNLVPTPNGKDAQGRPVYDRPVGAGFFIVVEAMPGSSGQPLGLSTFNSDPQNPTPRPDLQIESNKDLGNGSPAICDAAGPGATQTPGGVPAIPTPSFDPQSQQVSDALNDLGCRFNFRSQPDACTKDPITETPGFVSSDSTSQFCTAGALGHELELPSGDTVLTVRWRDQNGNLGNPASLVIHVP